MVLFIDVDFCFATIQEIFVCIAGLAVIGVIFCTITIIIICTTITTTQIKLLVCYVDDVCFFSTVALIGYMTLIINVIVIHTIDDCPTLTNWRYIKLQYPSIIITQFIIMLFYFLYLYAF